MNSLMVLLLHAPSPKHGEAERLIGLQNCHAAGGDSVSSHKFRYGRAIPNATWGQFSSDQAAVVSGLIRGQHVSDLGAGDLVGSLELVELGARMVSAFDRNPMPGCGGACWSFE